MLIPHVVSTEADKVFVNVLNTNSTTVSDGEALAWEGGTPDGVRTSYPTASTLGLFVGLALGSIAASAYGLAQAYGFKSVGSVSGDAITLVGEYLLPTAAVGYLTSTETVYADPTQNAFAYAGASMSSGTAPVNIAVFIRAL